MNHLHVGPDDVPRVLHLLLAELTGEHPAHHLAVPVLLFVLIPRHLVNILDVTSEVGDAVVLVPADLTHVDTSVKLGLDQLLLSLVHELLWLVFVVHHQMELELVILSELLTAEHASEP